MSLVDLKWQRLGTLFHSFHELLDDLVKPMVPIQVNGKARASACIVHALGVIVLKTAHWASACSLKRVPDVAAVAFPIGPTIWFPLALWTFNLDLRHPLQSIYTAILTKCGEL